MGVKESPGLRRPRPGVLPVLLIVLAVALVAALMAPCSHGPRPAPDIGADKAVLVEFYKAANGLPAFEKGDRLFLSKGEQHVS